MLTCRHRTPDKNNKRRLYLYEYRYFTLYGIV
jgi:hypothetical protein